MADTNNCRQEQQRSENGIIGNKEIISRQSVQEALAKAMELRAIHAALMQSNDGYSPAAKILRNGYAASNSSPAVSSHGLLHNFSAQDYPVFTPSYEDDPLPGYQQIATQNRNYAESWGEHSFLNASNFEESFCSDNYRTADATSSRRKGLLPSELTNFEGHICPLDDQHSFTSNIAAVLRSSSPGPNSQYTKSRRNSLGDATSVSSCNKCKPAVISSESESTNKNANKKSNIIVPLTDSHTSVNSQPRNSKGLGLSRLFPRLKKKNKNENSPVRSQTEDLVKDLGILSIETLKKDLLEANESREAALTEVAQMKSSLGELSQKLEYLESYCEELKNALRQAVQLKINNSQHDEIKLSNIIRRGKSIDGVNSENSNNSIPVTEEVMVEGFLQIVSESRLSVKQFCKTLLAQISETDRALLDNLNLQLQPHKISLGHSKHSKSVLYHLEAIIIQSLYQDFENSVFQRNGASKILNPNQDRLSRFKSFVALRNLGWSEVLRKGTKYYSEEFSKFCDQKMSGIITTLGWTKPWPEQLLQAFFVCAKCVWLLHLLAFSFNPPLAILRVDEDMMFEGSYMEDVLGDRERSQGPKRVKIMVMPGFYVLDRVLKCKVLCRYNKAAS